MSIFHAVRGLNLLPGRNFDIAATHTREARYKTKDVMS